MLVLSRRQNEKIVFPTLGVTLEILRVAGNCVRVGIDAPRDIKVLRHELSEEEGTMAAPQPSEERKLSHRMRNRLHCASLALHLLKRQLNAGMSAQAEETLMMALRELQQTEEELSSANRPARESPQPKDPHHRALLVEDDINEQTLMAGYLRMSGFEVDLANDGCEALKYLDEHSRPDVVLMDMQMPRRDGASTIMEIRSNRHLEGLKVFVVSGTPQEDSGVATGEMGADRWFPKPINPELLVSEMTQALKAPAFAR